MFTQVDGLVGVHLLLLASLLFLVECVCVRDREVRTDTALVITQITIRLFHKVKKTLTHASETSVLALTVPNH